MVFIQILVWYVVGLVCMKFLQRWLGEKGLSIDKQEVYVLAVLGPFIALLILYLLIADRRG